MCVFHEYCKRSSVEILIEEKLVSQYTTVADHPIFMAQDYRKLSLNITIGTNTNMYKSHTCRSCTNKFIREMVLDEANC